MKKVIAAIDAVNFTKDQLVNLNYIAEWAEGKMVAVFLENIQGEELQYFGTIPSDIAPFYTELNWKNIDQRKKAIEERVAVFNEACKENKIDAILHESVHVPINDIIIESRYADLLLVNNNTSFSKLFETDPPRFVKEVLKDAQCPVFIAPTEKKEIEELVFTYNGGYSSMFAIRAFTEIFQHFSGKKTTVLYVDEENNGDIPDKKLFSEYMNFHYSNWEFKILAGEPSFEILGYLLNKDKYVVTLGAYGRSALSQFFHGSDAHKMIRMLNTNIFITHP